MIYLSRTRSIEWHHKRHMIRRKCRDSLHANPAESGHGRWFVANLCKAQDDAWPCRDLISQAIVAIDGSKFKARQQPGPQLHHMNRGGSLTLDFDTLRAFVPNGFHRWHGLDY